VADGWDEPDLIFPESEKRSPMGFTLDDRCVVLLVKVDGKWQPTPHWTREACLMLPTFFNAHGSVDECGIYLEIE